MNKLKENFHAVLWDVDNTLIMSGNTHDQAVLLALKEFHPTKYDDILQLDILARAWDESWFACGGNADQLDKFESRVTQLYLKDVDALVARPGAVEAVHALNKMHVKQATVSNSRKIIVDANLRHLSIGDIIKKRICREDFAEPKPDPAPYLRAAEALNVPIALCLAVEDSLRGLASAKQAGATVIYWPHDTTPNNDCDYQVNAIQDINWEEFF